MFYNFECQNHITQNKTVIEKAMKWTYISFYPFLIYHIYLPQLPSHWQTSLLSQFQFRLPTNKCNYFIVWAMCLADSGAWTPTAALKIYIERKTWSFSDEVNNFSQYWLVKLSLSGKNNIWAVDAITNCSRLHEVL